MIWKLCLSLALNLTFLLPLALASDWELVRSEEGVRVYRREVPGSSLLAFKGDGIVNAPIAKVATVIFDTTRAHEWIEDLESSKIIRWVSKNEFVEYDHIGTPFILKDRDFLSLVSMKLDPEQGKISFHYRSTEDPAVPPTKYIRGELMGTNFVLTSVDGGKGTHIHGEIHADPKGSVPKWLVNHFQKNWPVITLKNLRRQVAKPDVQADPRFAAPFSQSVPSTADTAATPAE